MEAIDAALAFSRQTARELLDDAEATGAGWSTPLAPGKWSPSQVVEHVARSLDATTALARGEACALPKIPGVAHPLLRVLFRRLLKTGLFPKGRTTRPLHPAAGAPTPGEARGRLEATHARYEAACRELAERTATVRTPMFGVVPLADFIRFMALHTRHHQRQVAAVARGAAAGDRPAAVLS